MKYLKSNVHLEQSNQPAEHSQPVSGLPLQSFLLSSAKSMNHDKLKSLAAELMAWCVAISVFTLVLSFLFRIT